MKFKVTDSIQSNVDISLITYKESFLINSSWCWMSVLLIVLFFSFFSGSYWWNRFMLECCYRLTVFLKEFKRKTLNSHLLSELLNDFKKVLLLKRFYIMTPLLSHHLWFRILRNGQNLKIYVFSKQQQNLWKGCLILDEILQMVP